MATIVRGRLVEIRSATRLSGLLKRVSSGGATQATEGTALCALTGLTAAVAAAAISVAANRKKRQPFHCSSKSLLAIFVTGGSKHLGLDGSTRIHRTLPKTEHNGPRIGQHHVDGAGFVRPYAPSPSRCTNASLAGGNFWHKADNPTAPKYVRYWSNSGHWSATGAECLGRE